MKIFYTRAWTGKKYESHSKPHLYDVSFFQVKNNNDATIEIGYWKEPLDKIKRYATVLPYSISSFNLNPEQIENRYNFYFKNNEDRGIYIDLKYIPTKYHVIAENPDDIAFTMLPVKQGYSWEIYDHLIKYASKKDNK